MSQKTLHMLIDLLERGYYYDASAHMFPCCRVFVQQQITDGVKVWLELKKKVPRRTAECDDNVLTEGRVV